MPLPKVGDVVAGKYRIEGLLGEGGMAHVFAAHHQILDKPVAVKVLSPTEDAAASFATFVERFLAEARAAARVDSHHVARIMDVGAFDDGLPYMVLERLEGCNLEELLARDGVLRVEDAVDFVLQALAGLAHAHALGIVHRDLKPANLFLARQPDGGSIIKVLDFGVAKMAASDKRRGGRLTGEGGAVGTPMYMAPEQIRTPQIVDGRADIWATGVVLYELLTGTSPFAADSVAEILGAVLEREIPLVRKKRREVAADLEDAITKALERDPDLRYADVGEFARAIGKHGSGQWTGLVDIIASTLHGHVSRPGSGDLTPTGLPSRRGADLETQKTQTSATIDTPARPSRARRTSMFRVLVLGLAIAGATAWGWTHHIFDSLRTQAVAHIAPVPPPSESVSAIPSASSAPSASASVARPVPTKSAKPTPTKPAPTSTKKH